MKLSIGIACLTLIAALAVFCSAPALAQKCERGYRDCGANRGCCKPGYVCAPNGGCMKPGYHDCGPGRGLCPPGYRCAPTSGCDPVR